MYGPGQTDLRGRIRSRSAVGSVSYLPTLATAPSAVYGVSKLVSGYAGNLYRLVRANDSATLNIGAAANGSADTSGVAAFGSGTTLSVDTWYDQSGNGHHATQATAAARPLWDAANTIRGVSGILCGIDLYGNLAGSTFLNIPATHSVQLQSQSVFNAVAVGVGGLNTLGLWGLGSATDGSAAAMMWSSPYSGWFASMPGFRSLPDAAFSHFSPDVLSVVGGAANWKLRAHKKASSASAPTNATMTGGRIGHALWSASIAGPAAHFAMVCYPTPLSDTDAVLVEDALATIFSINLAPTAQITFDGDSITHGSANGIFMRSLPFVVGSNLSRYAGMYNTAVSGDTMANVYSSRSKALGKYSAGVAKNSVHLWAGTNDIAALAGTTFDTRLTTANTTSGSNVAVVADATSMATGNFVGSAQFPAGTTITGIAGTSITCSANATANSSGSVFRAMSGALATAAANNIFTTATRPYILAAIAAGYAPASIVVATTIPRFWQSISVTALYGYELTRQAYNAAIIAGRPTDGYTLADYGAVAGLGTGTASVPSNTYYHSDLIHLKAAGFAFIETVARAALNAAIA